jgi:hypothetical protein
MRIRSSRAAGSFESVRTNYILVGRRTPQHPSETVLRSLTALAPKVTALQLDVDYKIRDARKATDALLQMFERRDYAVARFGSSITVVSLIERIWD